jgi:hypothetical protein
MPLVLASVCRACDSQERYRAGLLNGWVTSGLLAHLPERRMAIRVVVGAVVVNRALGNEFLTAWLDH